MANSKYRFLTNAGHQYSDWSLGSLTFKQLLKHARMTEHKPVQIDGQLAWEWKTKDGYTFQQIFQKDRLEQEIHAANYPDLNQGKRNERKI